MSCRGFEMRQHTAGSAPCHRVYKSQRPLTQAKFPQRRRCAVIPAKHANKMHLKQETLTQMDFVSMGVFRDQNSHPEGTLEELEADNPRTKRQRTQEVPEKDSHLNSRRIRHEKHERMGWDRTKPARSAAHNIQDQWQNAPKKRVAVVAGTTAFEQKALKITVPESLRYTVFDYTQTPQRCLRLEIPASPGSQRHHSEVHQCSQLDRSCRADKCPGFRLPFSSNSALKVENGGSKGAVLFVNRPAESSEPSIEKNFWCLPSKGMQGAPPPSSHNQWIRQAEVPGASFGESSKSEISAFGTESDNLEEEQLADAPVASESYFTSMVENSRSTRNPVDKTFYLKPTSPSSLHSGGTLRPDNESQVIGIAGKANAFESQRLSTQEVISMAPRTMYSDVFVSLPSFQVRELLSQTKDHDIRNWEYPVSVRRIWIYERRPASALKYMAVISSAKCPGEVEQTGGLGNAEFNIKRGGNWRAYEIFELYELAEPLPLQTLIANEWLQGVPRKYEPVRPAVLDTLMANLMPPIFTCIAPNRPSLQFADIQHVGVRSSGAIEPVGKSELGAASFGSSFPAKHNIEEYVSFSRRYTPPGGCKQHLSHAPMSDLTLFRTPELQCREEIFWTSPTNLESSNTQSNSSAHKSSNFEYDAENSSQMSNLSPTKQSQALPLKYLDESAPGPPLFVRDSDDSDDTDSLAGNWYD